MKKFLMLVVLSVVAFGSQAQVGSILKVQKIDGSLLSVDSDANGRLVTSVAGALTDRSGTLAAAAVAQQVAAAKSDRKYLLIQNVSTGDLWINFGVSAVQAQPSIKIAAGATFVMDNGFVSSESVSIIGATLSQAFTAKEN